MYYYKYKINSLTISIAEKDSKIVGLREETPGAFQGFELKETRLIRKTHGEVLDYLRGLRQDFSVDIGLEGTDFQKEVWRELLRLDYGETVSYSQLAQRIARPRAFRALASAVKKNPILLILPCHRVIRKGGELGDYRLGQDLKEKLLNLEKRNKNCF